MPTPGHHLYDTCVVLIYTRENTRENTGENTRENTEDNTGENTRENTGENMGNCGRATVENAPLNKQITNDKLMTNNEHSRRSKQTVKEKEFKCESISYCLRCSSSGLLSQLKSVVKNKGEPLNGD